MLEPHARSLARLRTVTMVVADKTMPDHSASATAERCRRATGIVVSYCRGGSNAGY